MDPGARGHFVGYSSSQSDSEVRRRDCSRALLCFLFPCREVDGGAAQRRWFGRGIPMKLSGIHKDKEHVWPAALLLARTLCSPKQMVKCGCASHLTSKERQNQSFQLRHDDLSYVRLGRAALGQKSAFWLAAR